MSGTHQHRSNRKSSDFSIARILADNTVNKSLSSTARDGRIDNSQYEQCHTVMTQNDPHDFCQCEKIDNDDEDDDDKSLFRLASGCIDHTVVHLPSTSGIFQVRQQNDSVKLSSSCAEEYDNDGDDDDDGGGGGGSSSSSASDLYWLQCTRYRPPKLPRKSISGKICKRKPGTHPRIPFTTLQLDCLEEKYRSDAYLSRKDVIQLSTMLRLPHSRIKIWFQNRRARDKRENKVIERVT